MASDVPFACACVRVGVRAGGARAYRKGAERTTTHTSNLARLPPTRPGTAAGLCETQTERRALPHRTRVPHRTTSHRTLIPAALATSCRARRESRRRSASSFFKPCAVAAAVVPEAKRLLKLLLLLLLLLRSTRVLNSLVALPRWPAPPPLSPLPVLLLGGLSSPMYMTCSSSTID
jgi:hypothetical protein